MTDLLTPMTPTFKKLFTALATGKNRLAVRATGGDIFLPARTQTWRGKRFARRARTGMALQDTNMRTKNLLIPANLPFKRFGTWFSTGMWQEIQIGGRVRPLPTEANIPNLLG